MTNLRARLRIEQFEDRTNPSPVNIGFGTDVFTFNVAGYNIHQNNANFATTSSAFGFSEAEMTAAQVVDTRDGGTEMAALNDAFDGALTFGIPTSGAPSATTYVDSDGIVDITPTPTGPGKKTTTSGTILTGDFNAVGSNGTAFNGLEFAQQNAVFARSSTVPIIRSLFMVRNPTGSAITQQVGIFNNLGSDSGTTIFSTSSGDTTFTASTDRWITSFQNPGGTSIFDPRLLTVVQGPGTVTAPLDAGSRFTNGGNNPLFLYTLTVNPGETQYILAYVGLYASRAASDADGQALFNDNADVQSAGLLEGFSDDVLSGILNWNFSDILTPPPANFVVGTGGGVSAQVVTFSPTGEFLSSINPFPGYNGPVNVATGDVNNDGTNDLLAAPGIGSSHVMVFSGTDGSVLQSFFAFPGFTGGVSVAVGDVNQDGFADIVVGAGAGGFSHVKVFSGDDLTTQTSFFAYSDFNGAVSVAAGDVDGDGFADIVTGTGPFSSHVKVFSGQTQAEIRSFIAFSGSASGVTVAAGDLDGDGFADLIVGTATATSHVKTFDGQTNAEEQSFLAFDEFTGGVRVGFSGSDILVAAGPGSNPHVKRFSGANLEELLSFFVFDQGYVNGIFVG